MRGTAGGMVPLGAVVVARGITTLNGVGGIRVVATVRAAARLCRGWEALIVGCILVTRRLRMGLRRNGVIRGSRRADGWGGRIVGVEVRVRRWSSVMIIVAVILTTGS